MHISTAPTILFTIIKHTISERIVDTLFSKHKYLTSPIVIPEDTVLESAQRITEPVTANSNSSESDKMVLLKQLAKVFKQILEKNAQEVADKQLKNNGIKTYNEEPQPRLDVPQPMVGINMPEKVEEPQSIFVCPKEAVVD